MTSAVAPSSGLGVLVLARRALREALADTFSAARGQVRGELPALVSVSVPIEELDALAAFTAARLANEDSVLWLQPGSGESMVGMGVTASIALDGPDRFRLAADRWAALLTRRIVGGPAASSPGAGPVLLGGATFARQPSTDASWTGFEHGRLDLPALLLSRVRGEDVLTGNLVVDGGADRESATGGLLDLFDRVTSAWSQPATSSPGEAMPSLRRVGSRPDRAAWSSSVARSAGAVGRGRIDKVVLARRVDMVASAPIDATSVLARLALASASDAMVPVTVFAIGRSGRTFLGASPERLVEVHGRAFRTIALAGTTARGMDAAADADLATTLLASEKDREEHAVVVEMLRDTLAPITTRLDIERTPHIARLPTLQHLTSEVSGELRDDHGILDLVDRLHPTPAVGGWPRVEALELLDEQEHLDRGWYAAPVGWLDANGDGEFLVAIRSGVIEGDRASLFVGCGIVGDSEPDREWAESEMKLRSLASAIGRVEPADGFGP